MDNRANRDRLKELLVPFSAWTQDVAWQCFEKGITVTIEHVLNDVPRLYIEHDRGRILIGEGKQLRLEGTHYEQVPEAPGQDA